MYLLNTQAESKRQVQVGDSFGEKTTSFRPFVSQEGLKYLPCSGNGTFFTTKPMCITVWKLKQYSIGPPQRERPIVAQYLSEDRLLGILFSFLNLIAFASSLRTERSALQFQGMIECLTDRSAIWDYNGYGCWCGLGGKGDPVDATDR